MTARTPRSRRRQRERLEVTFGVVLIVGSLAFGLIFVLARTTTIFGTPTPVPTPGPTPTLTPAVDSRPLPLIGLVFTDRVTAGDTFQVEVATEPGTRCVIRSWLFLYSAGNYREVTLADYITDASGVCRASTPVTTDWATGEQAIRIQLQNGLREQSARWTFQVVAPG